MPTKSIIITNSKGGVGKSTLSFLLANNLSKFCKVAILDMDLQGSLSRLSKTLDKVPITTDKSVLEQDSNFQLVVVDTPPYQNFELPDLIQKADLILLPCKPAILDLLAIGATIKLISEANKEESALIVFNMVKANTTLTDEIRKRIETYGIKLAQTHVSDLVSFTRSFVSGDLDNDNAQKQLDNLTKEVLTALL